MSNTVGHFLRVVKKNILRQFDTGVYSKSFYPKSISCDNLTVTFCPTSHSKSHEISHWFIRRALKPLHISLCPLNSGPQKKSSFIFLSFMLSTQKRDKGCSTIHYVNTAGVQWHPFRSKPHHQLRVDPFQMINYFIQFDLNIYINFFHFVFM